MNSVDSSILFLSLLAAVTRIRAFGVAVLDAAYVPYLNQSCTLLDFETARIGANHRRWKFLCN